MKTLLACHSPTRGGQQRRAPIRWLSVAIITAVMTVLLWTSASAASAKVLPPIDLWEHAVDRPHSMGAGRHVPFRFGARNLHSIGFGDKTSVVVNRFPYAWCLYEDINYGGEWIEIAPESGDDLADEGGSWNDQVSSLRRRPAGGC